MSGTLLVGPDAGHTVPVVEPTTGGDGDSGGVKATAASPRLVPSASVFGDLPSGLDCLEIVIRKAPTRSVWLAAAGDTSFSGAVGGSDDEGEALAQVTPFLRNRDLAFANLEGAIVEPGLRRGPFAMAADSARRLGSAGFRVVHLANNHVLDHGRQGFTTTLEALSEAGVTALGAGDSLEQAQRLTRTDVGNLRIGWLGCGRTLERQRPGGPVFWELNGDELVSAARMAAGQVDVLVVSLHAGYMYLDYPAPEQRQLAHRLTRAGCRLVLMHHSHVLQGIEVTTEEAVICYSLGNFLLDWREGAVQVETMVEEQQRGALFCFDLDCRGVARVAVLPTWIEDRRRVRWALGEPGRQILERLRRISEQVVDGYEPLFERQRAERNTGLTLATVWTLVRTGRWLRAAALLTRIRARHLLMVMRWLEHRARSTG